MFEVLEILFVMSENMLICLPERAEKFINMRADGIYLKACLIYCKCIEISRL